MILADYREDFLNAVNTRAEIDNTFTSSAFTSEAVDRLAEFGEVENLEPIAHFEGQSRKRARMAVDAVDLENPDESVALAVTLYDPAGGTLTTTLAKSALSSLLAYVRESVDGLFQQDQEISTDAYQYARALKERGRNVSRYRLFLLTNLTAGRTLVTPPDDVLHLVPVEHHIWDIERFHQIHATAQSHVPLEIDLTKYAGGGLPALEIESADGRLQTFLTAVPGAALADLYGRYGSRLLEGNVRSFLSSRGKVNKGIRSTLGSEPERFMAYNNGITATAQQVQVSSAGALQSVRDLQIVNGGQTTASIFYVSRDSTVSLDEVQVQMKLIVVDASESQEMVPRISRYANSQNKVSDADFFSNSPFHRRMEELSRRTLTPARSGTRLQTKWFYERNRGQYQNDLAKLSTTDRKREEAMTPKQQVISKTDAATYLMAWDQQPHTVSMGAQKNFIAFANRVASVWETHSERFNEMYYKELVAKAMLYRELRRAISRAEWYDKGYLANLTSYAMSKLAHEVETRSGASFPFAKVWNDQAVPPEVLAAGLLCARAALVVLTSDTRTVSNVTEWAKREDAWARLRDQAVPLEPEFWRLMASKDARVHELRDAEATQRIDNRIDIMKRLATAEPDEWQRVLDFGKRKRLLTQTDAALLSKMSRGGFIPSDRQADTLVRLLRRAGEAGLENGLLD